MKLPLLFLSLILSITTIAQTRNKVSVLFQLQPELTFYKDNYAYRWRETDSKMTLNTGFKASLQYDLHKKWFAEAGIGYISRRLNTVAFLDQSSLPPPRQSLTQELVTTKAVVFRSLLFPVDIGYRFITGKRWNVFVNGNFTGNFLLNTRYELGAARKYEGRYKKNYWQGYSLNAGAGADYMLKNRMAITARLTWSFVNTARNDEYLFSQDQYGISLTHQSLILSAGIKLPLR